MAIAETVLLALNRSFDRAVGLFRLQRLEALQAAVARLEAGKAFDAVTDATDKLSRIFQVPAEQSHAEDSKASKEIARSN
jgi:hypothetical protein